MSRPPLVPPGPELTAQERTRYARHLLLPDLGSDGQRRLRAARVLVVGAGGLGSPALLYLAAAGVGTIGIVDDDVVDLTNLQRQVVHGVADVGRPKTSSAAESVRAISPATVVIEHTARLDESTA
ncbi:MAG: ThiF family adenylyltransferase, partial [Dermatophilaceae bacterium]|nr:ThiF family adenylyltransferase [Dermatophilaceae bacterium]